MVGERKQKKIGDLRGERPYHSEKSRETIPTYMERLQSTLALDSHAIFESDKGVLNRDHRVSFASVPLPSQVRTPESK